ncbi:hypothetical protein DYB32_000650 [Aphanomyces invadans]|uniref:Uncharacterized protein n=1 Tax=Aphanomyces invadans TaxID=157072 RepID=A0A418B9B1_9STRA|nr:hypothetical protein DYB32_000650 [Aphanomyces invadans]
MHLVDDYMLSSAQERHLFESLSFLGPEDEYLKCFYASQLGRVPLKLMHLALTRRCQYDPSPPVPEKFHTIETVHGLQKNLDVMVAKAEAYYCQLDTEKAYEICRRKATNVQPQFAPAWLGFGHVFALQDESDQAMASYRTASRLYLGCHLPLLCMGMEHYRINNLPSALQLVVQARTVCPTDPLVYNELGAVYFRQRKYRAAIEMFSKALTLCGHLPQASTHFGLGFTYHMQNRLDDAIESYHTVHATAALMLDEALRSLVTRTSLHDAAVGPPLAEETMSETNELSLTMDLSFESTDM